MKDVSVAEFADDWGVTTQRVYQWIGAGMPHRLRSKKNTRIVRREANHWLRDQAREAAQPKTKTPRARERKELAEAELKELTVQERRRTLIPLGEFEAFVDSLVGGFAAVAQGRLQRFERDIVHAATPAAARRITDDIHVSLMAGAQEYGDLLEREAGAMAEDAAEGAADDDEDAGS